MLGTKAKVLLMLGIVVAALAALFWGVSQYGKKEVAEARVAEVTEAVQSAQERRKAEVKADVSTRAKRRTTLDSVRSSGIPVEKHIAEVPVAGADPEFSRLLNSAIDDANRAIESARVVPD